MVQSFSRVDAMAGYGFKRKEAAYRITPNAKNLTRVNAGPIGFKPGSNEGYYFRSDPESFGRSALLCWVNCAAA